MADNRSHRSGASHYSRSSGRASRAIAAAAAAAQAKAEAAKARLASIDRELQLRMEMQILQLQRETAATIAEAEVLKAVADRLSRQHSRTRPAFNSTPADPDPHTARYCRQDTVCDKHNNQERTTSLHPEPQPGTLTEICNGSPHNTPGVALLPLKSSRCHLPQNRTPAENQLSALRQTSDTEPNREYGGEESPPTAAGVVSKCTQVCGGNLLERSCSKISLINIHSTGQPDNAVKMWAMIDEQSNRSLACSDIFRDDSPSFPYSLKTCAGVVQTAGRRTSGFQAKSLDGEVSPPLPNLIECNKAPDERDSILTPRAALRHPHLKSISTLHTFISERVHTTPFGPWSSQRDPLEALNGAPIPRTLSQTYDGSPHNALYTQKLKLRWVTEDNMCLGRVHNPSRTSTPNTYINEGVHPTPFEPWSSWRDPLEALNRAQIPRTFMTIATPAALANMVVPTNGTMVSATTSAVVATVYPAAPRILGSPTVATTSHDGTSEVAPLATTVTTTTLTAILDTGATANRGSTNVIAHPATTATTTTTTPTAILDTGVTANSGSSNVIAHPATTATTTTTTPTAMRDTVSPTVPTTGNGSTSVVAPPAMTATTTATAPNATAAVITTWVEAASTAASAVAHNAHFSSHSLKKGWSRMGKNSDATIALPPPLPPEVTSVVSVADQLMNPSFQTTDIIPRSKSKSDARSVHTLAASAMTTFLAVVTYNKRTLVAASMDPGEPCVLTHGFLLH